MIALLLIVLGTTSAVPVPQHLTLDEFQAKGRSLELPEVLFSPSYRQVRRQGRKDSIDNIKFPTLVVRDPNELNFGRSKKGALSSGPVYTPDPNALSTKDIEAKIKEVNEAAVKQIEEENQKIEEELAQAAAFEKTEIDELEREIEEVTDALAEEIVAEELEVASDLVEEEIEALTDQLAEEIVVEDLAKEMISEDITSLTNKLSEDIGVIELAEQMISEEIDTLTDKLAEEIVVKELTEELVEDALLSDVHSVIDMNILPLDFITEKSVTDEVIIEDEEGSGSIADNVDFGDIQEV